MHMQSVKKYCFSSSNMDICGVFVAVFVVVAKAPYYQGVHAPCEVINLPYLQIASLST